MRLELELLKQCSEASQLSANAVNGAVSAAHRIFTWATEDNLQESEAAPVVTEAIARAVAVLHTAEYQVAHPISQCTLLQLRDATQSLQRLMQSNTQTESSNLQEAESSSKIRLPTDHRPSSLIANLHIWIVVLVLFLFMAGATAAMCVIASQELQAYVEQSRHSRAVTLLGIAIDALDALYPFLQQAGVDIQLAGMTIAAAVLEEMSSATTTVDSEQTLFFNANDPLFEYRAGKQNFVQRGRVTAVTTQRTYGRLCTSNYSYLLHPTAQLSGAITEVFVHDLTPNRCVNDAGVSGVFRTVTPPYIGYAGYVQTYRTTSATVATFHHHNYDTSVAVTLDHNSLKNELKRYQSVLGFGDLFSEDDEAWRRRMGRWIALILTCAAFIAVSAAELIPFCRTQLHRAIVAVLMLILVGGTLAFVRVMVERTINIASKEVQLDGARLLARCLAAAMTSTTLNNYSTVTAFLEHVANGALESRMFTLHSSSKEPDSVYPSNMQHVAAIINSTNLAAERVVLQNGFHRSYCYASFFDISNDRFAVYVEPEDYQLRIRGALWIAAGAGLISFFFVYAYLRLSPLNRLACAGRGSPLLQRFIAPQHLRYVLYLMMLVIVAGAMIALNAYGASLVNAATEQLSKETLQVLGSTIRSPSLVDNCIGSCGLPSTVVMQRFVIDGTKATAVESRVPYPLPAGDWESHYYGAQLAMSKLPTVLEGMLSFSTPLVNRTSGYIEPRYLQHRMLASVDVNETFGFVLERLPSSTQSPTYAFVSQSIGLCLALGAVCIGVCVLEWLYTRMGRLQRERKSLLSSYVIMVVLVLLVSSMLMVNVAIMKSEMHRAIEEFATSELTLLSHAARGRLESVMRDGIVDGGPSRELLETLVAVARNMSYSVQAGTSILARWCISLEVGANGLMRVWCGDDSINGSRVILPRVLLVDVPVCEVVADKRLGHRMNKFACLAQLRVPNDGEAARVGRIFLVIWREYDDVVTSPSKHGWLNLLKASIVGWVFVTVALLLVLWWTMSTAHMTEFVFLATGERISLTRALVLPNVGMAERWLPWRYRVGWLMIRAMAMLLVLWYLSVFGSYLMRQVHEVEEVDVVYETQDDLAVAMVTALTASAYSFIIYPDRKLLSGSFSRATASESPTTYNFISESRRSDFWGVVDKMKEALLSDNVMLSYLPSTFVSTGVDSSQSLIAMAYSDYVTHQKKIMEWMKSITTAIQFFTRTEDNFTLVKVPPALFSCSKLSSLLRKLFILDHISVASYVDFSGKRGANARWPFKVLQDANEIVQAISVASSTIASTIDMEMQTLRDCIDDLMQTSVEADDVHHALEKVRSSYADSCAIYTPSASIWNIQDFRCFEASIIGNRTIMVRDHLQLEALHEELTAAANTMTQLCADDVQQRSNVQLREQILSRSGVGELVSTLEWERADIARSCRYQSIVMVGCSLPLFLVVVMVSSALLIIQRRAAISSCAVPELMSCLRSESDNMTDKPPTQGSCWGARVLGIGGLLALLPMIAASLLILDFMRHSLVDHVEGMSLDVVQLQTSMIMHIDEYLAHSAIGYSLGTTSELKRIFGEIVDDVESLVFSMRTLRGSSTNALVIEATGRMQQLVRTAQSIFMTEMDLYKSQTFLYEQIPYHDPLSFYARQVLLTMTPEDNYSILLPMGVTGVGVVPDFAQNLYSNSANPVGVDAIDTYAQQLISLDGASKAYLNMWHVAVTAAAKGGESIAATYWDFEYLVGTDALTPLSSSGVASAGAAVTAITTFFAPLLAVSTTKDAVETLFTTTDAPTNETGPVSAYLNAAYVSTYLGSINTSATFANVYAYNRGLTNVSQLLAGKPSLCECIHEMVATSEYLITKGISTSEYTYSIQPAAINTWIWSSELRGAHQSLSVYDDFSYLYLAMQWCCITAVWVVAAACCVIFLRW